MRKILVPQNIHEKKFWTHKIPTRQNFGATKYHEKKIWTHEIPAKIQRHDSTRPTKPTIARDSLNVAHFILYKDNFLVQRFVSYADVSIYLESSTLNHGKEAV